MIINEKPEPLCALHLSDKKVDHRINNADPITDGLNDNNKSDEDDGTDMLLGVDIGTTSISAQLIRMTDGTPVHTYNITHGAEIKLSNYPDAFAADAGLLVRQALDLIKSLTGTYTRIKAIGLTGQMHGIVCVSRDCEILSPLYTWQNEFGLRRKNGMTYLDLIYALCGEHSSTGYGLVTYFCLRDMGLLPERTASIMTVMDLAVMRLCGIDKALSHATNAASLGFFDPDGRSYEQNVLKRLDIETSLLPEVTCDYRVAGYYNGIPVAVAVGDNQAGIFGSLSCDSQALLNIGTSGQISSVMTANKGTGDIRPYFGERYIITGATLCGGRAYSLLADFFADVIRLGGTEMSKTALYNIMNELADTPPDNELQVSTKFFGTRTETTLRGKIENLGADNFTAAHFVRGILRGIVTELYEMYCDFPSDVRGGINELVVSGNAVRFNPAMARIISEVFGMNPRIPAHTEEAAYGATLYAAISAGLFDETHARTMIKYI